MDFNSFNDEYRIRNPNDFGYQSEPNLWVENLKFNVQTAVDNIAMNVQTAVDNLAVNVRTLYENYKQNIHMDNDPYENLNTNLQFASNQSIEPLNNTFASNQSIEPLNNTFGNMEPLQLDFKQTMNETSIIHEELAEKESRIRHLESIQIQNTNEISQLKAEKLEDRKKIKHLDNEVKKIKANPFLKWLERATEDSKKERII